MKKIYVYIPIENGLLHSFDELDSLNITNDNRKFNYQYGGYDVIVRNENYWWDQSIELETDGVHIIKSMVFDNDKHIIHNLIKKVEYNDELKIIIIGGNLEHFIFCSNSLNDEKYLIHKISESKNIKLLHNIPLLDIPNTQFYPKIFINDYINIQRYAADQKFIEAYYSLRHIFPKIKKEKRIGVHIGGINTPISDRISLVRGLIEKGMIDNPKLFYTTPIHHQYDTHLEVCNELGYPFEKYKRFDTTDQEARHSLCYIRKVNYRPVRYLAQATMLSMDSDIELVYETNIQENSVYLSKLTEKSLKMFALGKPSMNIDPFYYWITKKYGFETYDELYGGELLDHFDLYKNLAYHDNLSAPQEIIVHKTPIGWMGLFVKRIGELLDMSDTEWRELMDRMAIISQRNRERFDLLYFEGGVIDECIKLGWI
jgi:hypothetical protein